MKKILFSALLIFAVFCLDSCTIETSKKKDGFKIEINTNDELVINGEKITDKKLDREIKKLIKDLEKEGLTREEIRKSIKEGKTSIHEAIDELKQELKQIKSDAKDHHESY